MSGLAVLAAFLWAIRPPSLAAPANEGPHGDATALNDPTATDAVDPAAIVAVRTDGTTDVISTAPRAKGPTDRCCFILRGRVVTDDSAGVPRATLAVLQQSAEAGRIVAETRAPARTQTDGRGVFALEGATVQHAQREGSSGARIEVLADGFEAMVLTLPLLAAWGDVDLGEVVLQRLRTIDVTVRDERGAPIADALVFVRPLTADLGSTSGTVLDTSAPDRRTDGLGRCRAFAPERGNTVFAIAMGFVVAAAICGPESSTCTITLADANMIRIACRTPDDRPAIGARVQCNVGSDVLRLFADQQGEVALPQPADTALQVWATHSSADGLAYGGRFTIPAHANGRSTFTLSLERQSTIVDLRWQVGLDRVPSADRAMLITSWSKSDRFLRSTIGDAAAGQALFAPGPPALHRIRVFNAALGFGETDLIDSRQVGTQAEVHWREPGLHRPLTVRVVAPDGSPTAGAGVRFVFPVNERVWPPLSEAPFRLTLERRCDERGVVTLPMAPRTAGICTVLATGHAPTSMPVDAQRTELTVKLATSCALTLSVPGLEPPRGHHLAVLDTAGDIVLRAAIPATGGLRLTTLPAGPVDLRIEADIRHLRRVAGIVDASYLASFADPPPLIRWSQRVQLQVDRDGAIVAEALPPLSLSQIDVQFDGDVAGGRLAVTRLAVRGVASGKPRSISVPIADRRIRVGGLEAGEYAVEAIATDGAPWWWGFCSVVDCDSPCALVVRAADRHELRLADHAWQADSTIHRVTADGHPLRWSTVPIGDPVQLSPGSYQVLGAAGNCQAQFTVGPHGGVTMHR